MTLDTIIYIRSFYIYGYITVISADQKQLGRGHIYFILHFQERAFHQGKSGQKFKQGNSLETENKEEAMEEGCL